jgi:ferrous iron transport protein B
VGESGEASDPIIALVGAPNVGKSTLFNALTGAHVTMGNWPGTTVEVSRGVWRNKRGTEACECSHCTCSSEPDIRQATLIDLPGAYSLEASSPDEHLTRTLVADVPEAEAPDLVLAVVDAAHLARSLYLVAELRERSRRIVLAVTMDDVARRQGVTVDSYALSEAVGAPAVIVDPRRRVGLDHLMRAVRETLAAPAPAPRRAVVMADSAIEEIERSDPGLEAADERFAWVAEVAELGTTTDGEERVRVSDRIDRVALAPVAGPLVFLAIMWLVFQITTTVAAPLQDFLDGFFSGPVSTGAVWLLERVGLGGTWVEGLLVDGLIAGVGMLLTFVPLMILMFILLALLEDSGYLARAAVLTDRVMGALGLPGRAFLPLVVGFGCNVPAIAGTRILPHARQRLLTVLLVPFTSCTARLTVFVMLGAVFFGRWAGTAVFAMYAASILIVVLTGLALRKTLWRTMPSEPLVIDLPPYQAPTVRLTAQVTWLRLKGFLQTASGIIVLTVIGVWLLQAIPVDGGTFGHVAVGDSLYAWLAEKVAPVFDPAGFGQWQTVAALVVGFVAKEAVISSWGQTYAVADPEDVTTLGEHIRAAFEVSSGGHPTAAALAFMIFLLAYTPCLATLAAQKREVGWRWMGFGFVLQLVVAYVLAVVVFQIGRLIV